MGAGRGRFAAILLLATLWGCQGARERVLEEATTAALTRSELTIGAWRLATWIRPAASGVDSARLTLYIEGDGYAWARRDLPSSDPTPRHPLALALAARDPAVPLVYLARPCQFVPSPGCAPAVWTWDRFSPEWVTAMDGAISALMGAHGARRVRLVGFSGGGVLAALIAARRTDVEQLITLAAPLDLDAWTRHHGVTPLPAASSPLRYGSALRRVPQLHLVGERDPVVPAEILESFLRQVQPEQGELRRVPGLGHEDGWEERWSGLIQGWTGSPAAML